MPAPGSPTHEALIAALAWQAAAGVTDALDDAPVDRAATAQTRRASARAAKPATKPSSSTSATAPAPDAAAPPSDEQRLRDARALAASAARVQDLRGALERFDGSPLREHATQPVLGDGRPDAWTMVVGEAPGRDEDLEGRPFVGRSGRLLDKMLAEIGLTRSGDAPDRAFFVANAIPYRPLANRTPDDREVLVLLPFLRRQIALVRPKLLLCVGNVPAKHIMGARTGITRYRGAWTRYAATATEHGAALEASAEALASFHPAYLLRSPERKREAWRDLLSLAEKLDALRSSAFGPRG